MVAALLAGGMAGVSGQAFAHWSSGPFLYNDAGTNPMQLDNDNLAVGVANNGKDMRISGVDGVGKSDNRPGTFGNNTATGTSYGTYTQTRAVSSDYGWIQGQDNSLWANNHDNKGLAFTLANKSKVTFTVTTLGTATSVVQTQATGGSTVTNLKGQDWTPAFSIFSGMPPQSAHEGGAGNTVLDDNLPGYVGWGPYASAHPYSAATDATYEATTGNTYTGNGTWGAYRSNADWIIGRDISGTATFGNGNLIGTDQTLGGNNNKLLTFIDSAQAADGTHTVTWSGELDAGDYSIWVGGTNAEHALQQRLNYMALYAANLFGDSAAKAAATAAINALRGSYGFTIETTVAAASPVSQVPVPGAVWLFGSAMAGFIGLGRRKQELA
ncbi:hypothetical protein NP603_20170 [Methylomonas sp. SURF-1]|uniref:PEP-CTERM sorting domain-containing protein n=1 Tax=Methylomonas aurea TaxID=2952224 RepID=A0ABT1UNZ3_9GAMM|nr:hypothetical protein [Methylomonas sp. SURF-1]MCQ8183439.1 hypothetical protein [Methylomonas sp. SURF-1]